MKTHFSFCLTPTRPTKAFFILIRRSFFLKKSTFALFFSLKHKYFFLFFHFAGKSFSNHPETASTPLEKRPWTHRRRPAFPFPLKWADGGASMIVFQVGLRRFRGGLKMTFQQHEKTGKGVNEYWDVGIFHTVKRL